MLFAQLLVSGNLVFSHVMAEPVDGSQDIAPESLRPLLNSQRIEKIFGNYQIEVLKNGDQLRVSDLHSLADGVRTTRTLALVTYDEKIDQELTDEHRMIVRGQSIGEVFLAHAWVVEKENRYFGEIEASQDYAPSYAKMGDIPATNLAVHIYELFVRKGDLRVHYADIAEVHHPDFLDLVDLQAIYAEFFEENLELDENISNTLDLLKAEMKNI
jgi:hypothetical protein